MARRAETGFSYLEVLLALANFAIGFAALASLSSVVGERNQSAMEIAAATLIAETQLERLKLVGYDGLTDTGSIDGSLGPLDSQGNSSASGRYTVTWDVRSGVPMASARTVVVQVSWTTDARRARTVTLQTVLTDVSP